MSRSTSKLISTVGAYVILFAVAAIMLFPFFFMLAGALKTPDDTFRYPPKILPRTQAEVVVDGEAQSLFRIADAATGVITDMYPVETGLPAGVFVDPVTGAELSWPLDRAEATGVSTPIGGVEVPLFDVSVDGSTRELALIRDTVLARFVAAGDPSAEGFGIARTAERSETIDAQWQNSTEIIELRNFDRSLTNTMLVTILVVGGTLFTSIMGGYAFSRIRFKGRGKIFVAYIGSIMVPFIVLIVPLFRVMVWLEWVDTLGSLVWPFLFNAYGTFLMRQYFVSIPAELEEPAFIDGARRWTILWRIYVPLSWPAIATLATFMFLYAWNSFIWPLVSINGANTEDFVFTIALSTLGG